MLLNTRHDCQTAARQPLRRRAIGLQAIRALLLASVALGLPACVSDPHLEPSARAAAGKDGSPTETLLRVARGTRDNGDFATAVTVYKRVHEMAPQRADVLVELGQTLSALGAHNEAADIFREAIKLDPKSVDALRGLGNNLLAMNQPELALEQFVAGLAIQEDPRLYNGMAVVHDMIGSHESAQDNYRSGLALAPNDSNLRNNMALSLALAGKFDEAIQVLGRLVNENKANPRHRQNLALIYGLAGKLSEAASVARVDLDEPTVQNNLAFYETLRAMSPQQRAAAVFGITVISAPSATSAYTPKTTGSTAMAKPTKVVETTPSEPESKNE